MVYRIVGGLMTALFLLSVAVQYNDPDPAMWMAIYGVAAIVAGWAVVRNPPWILPALLAAGSLTWAATIAPRVFGKTTLKDTFGSIGMKGAVEEEAREMLGLALIGLWMLVVAIVSFRRRRRAA